jgi:hypothetical protein
LTWQKEKPAVTGGYIILSDSTISPYATISVNLDDRPGRIPRFRYNYNYGNKDCGVLMVSRQWMINLFVDARKNIPSAGAATIMTASRPSMDIRG